MKNKWIALLLALAMTVSLSACGSSANADSSADASASQSAQSDADTSADSGAGSSEEETPEAENLPADGDASGEADNLPADSQTQPESKPVTGGTSSAKPSGGSASKPSAGAGTSKPSGGSDSSAAKTVDLSAFYTTVSSDPDFPGMMQLTGESLDSFYAGLSDLSPKQCVIYMPMMSAVACEIALLECASSADVQSVKTIFQARIDYQINQGAWYPETVESWKTNSKIVTNGNYVMLVCSDKADSIASSFNGLFK